MKKYSVSLFSLLFFLFWGLAPAHSNFIEVDLGKKSLKIVDLDLAGYSLSGDFSLRRQDKDGYSIFFLSGEDVLVGQRKIGSLHSRITTRGKVIFVDSFESLKFSGHGSIDLKEENFIFNFKSDWFEDTDHFRGDVSLTAKAWGWFDSFLASGQFIISDGSYEGIEFDRLQCSFFGSPPVFSLTDMELFFAGRGSFQLRGELDLRDPGSFFPSAELVSHKLFLEGWEVFSGQGELGFRRKIDDRFDIRVETEADQEGSAELRYSLERDNFLKLRIEKEDTILGVERRREF